MDDERHHIDLETEQTCILRSQKDINHFQPLYEKYYDEIFRFIYRRVEDEMVAADLCSDTFYKALRNIKKFKWQGRPFGAWLYTIAANEIKKHYRKGTLLYLIEEDRIAAAMEEEIDDSELLRAVFAQLSDDELVLLEWKFFEGKTFKEIALLNGQSESAVKMKVYRLLDRLKKTLRP